MHPSVRRTVKVLLPLVAMLGLLAAPSGASALDFGKVTGWWPLNEGRGQTIYDWSGQGNHGTLGSTPVADANDPTWIKGIFWGSALNFGGDDFVKIPNDNSLEPGRFTISLWVRAPQSPGQFKYLLAKGNDACQGSSYGIWTASSGGIEFYVGNGHDFVRAAGTANGVWDGRWHNVSATYDGFQAKLYLDGKDLGDIPGSPDPISYAKPDGTLAFGGYLGSCPLLFSGDIDQVMMFDKVLPITQIWDRYGWLLNKPTLG
jgi:concanavalin A-like lectin/glucanase superfamily protein